MTRVVNWPQKVTKGRGRRCITKAHCLMFEHGAEVVNDNAEGSYIMN